MLVLVAPASAGVLVPSSGDVVGALPAAPEPLVFAVPMRGPLESPFGPRWGGFHAGIDIGVLRTDAVHAALPGVVLAVGWLPHYEGYGNVVKLRNPGGIITLYAHLARSLVRPGQRVTAGQPIAVMGHTGDAVSLGQGHIEIGFSDAAGDPLSHHGAEAWTPAGAVMRSFLVTLSDAFHVQNG